MLAQWMLLFTATATLPLTIASSSTSQRWLSGKGAALATRGGAVSRDDVPYSFSLTSFSPRGSLTQIEYASNAVLEGALTVAITYEGGVVMASVCKAESPLVVDIARRKIAHVADSTALLYSGLAADSRILARCAQEWCLRYQLKFGSDAVVPLTALVSELALLMQEYTQMAGVRPFGVALLVAGFEPEDNAKSPQDDPSFGTDEDSGRPQSRLYKLEPSGRYSAWKAAAIGKGSAAAENILQREHKRVKDRNGALDFALSVVLRCASSETKRADIELAFVENGRIQIVDMS